MAVEVLVKVLITLVAVVIALVITTSAVVFLIGLWNTQLDPWQTLKNLFTRAIPQTQAVVKREADAIYQNSVKVGQVVGNVVDDNDSIVFECLADTENLDRTQPFQYRRQTLSIRSIEAIIGLWIIPNAETGELETFHNVLQGVACEGGP